MTKTPDGMDNVSSSLPMEMPAVKTTIVGGRPPGCGKMLGEIPRGIEVLVKKASVDPAFRAVLLSQRSKAAAEIGLKLAPAEALMLEHVPLAQLEAIINRTKVDPSRRNAFLSKAAGVMLAALGATTGLDCATWSGGARPLDSNFPAATQPATQPASKPAGESLSRGIRPDVPALRGASGDSVLIAADEPAPPPLPPPPRPAMKVAGVMVAGLVATPIDEEPPPPAQTQPASTQPALTPAEYDVLVKQMDDENYAVREAAQKKVLDQGIRILPAVRATLQGDKLSPEVRSRLESIATTLAATTKPAQPDEPAVTIGIRAMKGLTVN